MVPALSRLSRRSIGLLLVKMSRTFISEFEIGLRSLEWGRRLYRRALELFPPCMKPTAVELPAHAEYALVDLEAERAMTDDELRALLVTIRGLALRPCPFPKEPRNDPTLVWAIGRIAGIASAALQKSSASPLMTRPLR